jgi:periplasmic protein TonB
VFLAICGGVFVSDMGSLSGCILENDPETQGRARVLRGKALAASLTLEAALLAAFLIWPLIIPGALDGKFMVTPLPPYSGGNSLTDARPRRAEHQPPPKSAEPRICFSCSKPAMPTRPQNSSNADFERGEGPALGSGFDSNSDASGPLIPGGDANNKTRLDIKKPEPPQPVAPRHMSEGVMEAALIRKVQPEYPTLARVAHVSGMVRLRAIIGTDGRIRELEVISGSPFLQASAVAAVREWRYRPTLLNGRAVEVETLITVNFVLDQP